MGSTGHKVTSRLDDLVRFYEILEALERRGDKRLLRDCHGRQNWPQRGVYFFFEKGEERVQTGAGARVVRVGTHALKNRSKTTLWRRLSQHRGTRSGGGHHRGSVFRKLIGQVLIDRFGFDIPTWGIKEKKLSQSGLKREQIKSREIPVEQEVSKILGAMELLWVPVEDDPGPKSLRGFIERNSIALLSNYQGTAIDPPSDDWLGRFSDCEKVQRSGLWNSDYVGQVHEPAFLDVLERFADAGKPVDHDI